MSCQETETNHCQEAQKRIAENREFDTGATRSALKDKIQYSRLLDSRVEKRVAEYLHKHRTQADGQVREPDNWKKGIPIADYVDSLERHRMDIWLWYQGYTEEMSESIEETLCALIFNAKGILFELAKGKTAKDTQGPNSTGGIMNKKALITIILFLATLETAYSLDCQPCHAPKPKVALTEYFKQAGSKKPEKMATAVLATKKPRLLAAVAKIETNGNPHIRRGGYKGQHAGAFQVNPRIHGKVSHNAVTQALQAEAILEELISMYSGDLGKALSAYGGDSTSRYQKQILAELIRVP